VSSTPASSIDEYISRFPAEVQGALEEVRATVAATVPEATEAISYAIPTFDLRGRHLVHFAAWERYLSMYPVPRDPALAEELARFQHGKGTLRFPLNKPIPCELIGRIVAALAEQAPR
jgi:uncharacterized protein YdhG (YjbR/CyaY superfamily)